MNKIEVSFNEKNQAEFDINATDEQILTALLGIESFISSKSGLPIDEIRHLMDEMKLEMTVKKQTHN